MKSHSSLKCLSIIFLLSGCVSKSLFLKAIQGGEETLSLFQRLGLVFTSHDEVIVPLVHLFPLDIPAFIHDDSQAKDKFNERKEKGKKLVSDSLQYSYTLVMTTVIHSFLNTMF